MFSLQSNFATAMQKISERHSLPHWTPPSQCVHNLVYFACCFYKLSPSFAESSQSTSASRGTVARSSLSSRPDYILSSHSYRVPSRLTFPLSPPISCPSTLSTGDLVAALEKPGKLRAGELDKSILGIAGDARAIAGCASNCLLCRRRRGLVVDPMLLGELTISGNYRSSFGRATIYDKKCVVSTRP